MGPVPLVLLSVLIAAHALCYNPATVAQLNLQQYAGQWFQQAESRLVADTIERNITCATAIYTINSNDTISVHNQGRVGSPNGTYDDLYGLAEIPDASQPGKLKVYLNGSYIPHFGAPYWILQVGPVVNNQYSWAIVSDNFCASLFILTRVQVASPTVLTTMQTYCTSVGFSLKDWVPMSQQDCVYA